MNLPPETPPSGPQLPNADLTRQQAWQELHRQLELLHAQLQYAKLLIKLGVGGH